MSSAPLATSAPRIPAEAISAAWVGVDHVEGVAVERDGTVWAGGEEGQVYRGRIDGEPEQIATLPGQALGIALDGHGGAYVAVLGPEAGLHHVDADGATALVAGGTDERPPEAPNFPVILESGTVVWTDSGAWGDDDGRIYAWDGRETRIADTSCSGFPNGLALAPDGRTLVVVESTLPGVAALAIGEDGTLSGRRVLVEMPGTVPDGVAFDARGRLLISCYAPDAIYLLEDGELGLLAHDPLRMALSSPTNVAFVPGTKTVVSANLGERYLSVFEHDAEGA